MADHNSLILQIIKQLIATQLPNATERVALRLLAQLNLDCRQVNLTWDDFLLLCDVSTRGGSRHHLIQLKNARIIHYSTTNDYIFITFLTTISTTRAGDQPPARGWSRDINEQLPTPEKRASVEAASPLAADGTQGVPASGAESTQPRSPARGGVRAQAQPDAAPMAPSPYIGSLKGLGLGKEGSEPLQATPPMGAYPQGAEGCQNEQTLQALAFNLLDECGVVKEPEKLATTVSFTDLRAIALRWRQDTRAQSPGSLIYRIIHRHKPNWNWQLAPLTTAEYHQPFIQRYRTDEEIERDERCVVDAAVPMTNEAQPAAEPSILFTIPPEQVAMDETKSAPALAAGHRQNLFNWHANPLPQLDQHNDNSVWQTVKYNFTLQEKRLSAWLEDTYVLRIEGDTWIISTPSYAKDMLQHRLAGKIARALSQATQQVVNVRFEAASQNSQTLNYS